MPIGSSPSHGGYPTPGSNGSVAPSGGQFGSVTIAAANPVNGVYTSNILAGVGIGSLSLDGMTIQETKREVDLPARVWRCEEDGKWFSLTLNPEHTMTPYEALLIMRLMYDAPKSLDVIGFVRKNNLEKHFKFGQ